MTSTLRVSEPRELLALIPHQLGFSPTNSLVLVSLRTPRSQVGLVARVDLEDLADREFGPQLARSLVAHLDSDRAVRCILVCYVSRALDLGDLAPREASEAVQNLEDALNGFFPVDGLFVVDPKQFHQVDRRLNICEQSRSIVELQATAVGAQMVMAGNVVATDRRSLGDLMAPSDRDCRIAQKAQVTWSKLRSVVPDQSFPDPELDANLTAIGGRRAPKTTHQWRVAGLRLWRLEVERAQTAADIHTTRGRPTTWGRLAAALTDVAVRDAALLSLVVGTSLPEESLASAEHDSEIAAAIAAILDPAVGRAPDPYVVGPSSAVLRMVIAHAGDQCHAPAATLLALIAWWEGKGAQASVWLERAHTSDSEYRLALLLAEAIDSGMPPGWVRQTLPTE